MLALITAFASPGRLPELVIGRPPELVIGLPELVIGRGGNLILAVVGLSAAPEKPNIVLAPGGVPGPGSLESLESTPSMSSFGTASCSGLWLEADATAWRVALLLARTTSPGLLIAGGGTNLAFVSNGSIIGIFSQDAAVARGRCTQHDLSN
jgi:hypothetical protein